MISSALNFVVRHYRKFPFKEQNPTRALKWFKVPGNTFKLNSKLARTLPLGIVHEIFIGRSAPSLFSGRWCTTANCRHQCVWLWQWTSNRPGIPTANSWVWIFLQVCLIMYNLFLFNQILRYIYNWHVNILDNDNISQSRHRQYFVWFFFIISHQKSFKS